MGEERVRLGLSYNPLLPAVLGLGIIPIKEVLTHTKPSLSADKEEPQQDPSPTITNTIEAVVKFEVRFGIAPQLRLDCAGEN